MGTTPRRRRVLVPSLQLQSATPEQEVLLDKEFAHYLGRVLRLEPGEIIEISDGSGFRWSAEITDISSNEVHVRLCENISNHQAHFPIYLAQALVKNDRFDLILRQCTEMGVHGILPFVSERCVTRLDAKKAAKRLERWQKIVRESARQSEKDWIPEIFPLSSLDKLKTLESIETLPHILCWEGESQYMLTDWTREHLSQTKDLRGVVIVVGPEGGFSASEVERLHHKGMRPTGLGSFILRTETAGISVLAVLQYLLGFFGGSEPPLCPPA